MESQLLPCDTEGLCMKCKALPLDSETILCDACDSPWHMLCLIPPLIEVPLGSWVCPDCNISETPPSISVASGNAALHSFDKKGDTVSLIRAIQCDPNLTDAEKAIKRQEILNGKFNETFPVARNTNEEDAGNHNGKRNLLLDEDLKCVICFNLLDRPITTSCGHNCCLKCFQRWVNHGKSTCPKCRTRIEPRIINQPRINSILVAAIRISKISSSLSDISKSKSRITIHPMANESRPDSAFTSARAVKTGKANACSGRIFVTIPPDHFGPITSEYDPRGRGVLVGETWQDRLECRQWGAHFPHVAGIAGQSGYGAQSVALSGGYEDDEDMGEWFLYTGSGGRDLSGNKRTNKVHSFDQRFEKANEALKVSCLKGYPVRVVRSHKEKRSAYAPEDGVRYDGIYRIEMCWRKMGAVGYYVCRYLFVRCDNSPAPWSSDEVGDRPRKLPKISELQEAIDITARKFKPAWDFKEENEEWRWVVDPPQSKKIWPGECREKRKTLYKGISILHKNLLKDFKCTLCKGVLSNPVSTPCGHNFCKSCLLDYFKDIPCIRIRGACSGRSLRNQRISKRCPFIHCNVEISDWISNVKVNLEMAQVIEKLKKKIESDEEEKILDENEIQYSNEDEDSKNCTHGKATKDTDSNIIATAVGSDDDDDDDDDDVYQYSAGRAHTTDNDPNVGKLDEKEDAIKDFKDKQLQQVRNAYESNEADGQNKENESRKSSNGLESSNNKKNNNEDVENDVIFISETYEDDDDNNNNNNKQSANQQSHPSPNNVLVMIESIPNLVKNSKRKRNKSKIIESYDNASKLFPSVQVFPYRRSLRLQKR